MGSDNAKVTIQIVILKPYYLSFFHFLDTHLFFFFSSRVSKANSNNQWEIILTLHTISVLKSQVKHLKMLNHPKLIEKLPFKIPSQRNTEKRDKNFDVL